MDLPYYNFVRPYSFVFVTDIWQLQCTGGIHTTCETFGFAQSKNQVPVYSLKIIPHGEQDNHETSW
jgi:hypothetical protein